MLILNFSEFKTLLNQNESINIHNSYIQWSSEYNLTGTFYEDFINKKDNTHILRIISLIPSKDKVIIISFKDLIEECEKRSSVLFNKMNARINADIAEITKINTQERLEIACELYRAQANVMSILTTKKILVLEDCLQSSRECLESSRKIASGYRNMFESNNKKLNAITESIIEYKCSLAHSDNTVMQYTQNLDIANDNYNGLLRQYNDLKRRHNGLLNQYHRLGNTFMDLENAYYSHKHLDQSLGTVKTVLGIGTTLMKIL